MPTFKNCTFIGVNKKLLLKEEREIKDNETFENCTFLVDEIGSAIIIRKKKRWPKINLWSNLRRRLLKK